MPTSKVSRLVKAHDEWRGNQCLNLIPSENVTSQRVRELLTSDMGHRYRADDHFYQGSRYMDELESYGEKLASKLFGSDWASLRPLSGHMADMIVVSTLARPGTAILSVDPANGGYPGIGDQGGYSQFVNVKNLYFPYDNQKMNIDIEKSQTLIEKEKPAVVIFGQSFFLFPHPVKELADICRAAGSHIAFDGSHVLGLIAGREFQRPLQEGAELLFGSTHKSLFGPQGGMILGSKNMIDSVKQRQFPGLVDNGHWNRIAALTWALDEARRKGRNYARQVIANAKALAKSLHEGGVPVRCSQYGFTASHQVYLDIADVTEIEKFTNHLEQANIIVDHGIRLGTCEATRRGMKKSDMEDIAELIVRVYNGEQPRSLAHAATRIRRQFRSILYV